MCSWNQKRVNLVTEKKRKNTQVRLKVWKDSTGCCWLSKVAWRRPGPRNICSFWQLGTAFSWQLARRWASPSYQELHPAKNQHEKGMDPSLEPPGRNTPKASQDLLLTFRTARLINLHLLSHPDCGMLLLLLLLSRFSHVQLCATP